MKFFLFRWVEDPGGGSNVLQLGLGANLQLVKVERKSKISKTKLASVCELILDSNQNIL